MRLHPRLHRFHSEASPGPSASSRAAAGRETERRRGVSSFPADDATVWPVWPAQCVCVCVWLAFCLHLSQILAVCYCHSVSISLSIKDLVKIESTFCSFNGRYLIFYCMCLNINLTWLCCSYASVPVTTAYETLVPCLSSEEHLKANYITTPR